MENNTKQNQALLSKGEDFDIPYLKLSQFRNQRKLAYINSMLNINKCPNK